MVSVVKVAKTSEEIDDVFWLRHEVYVIEDGKFGGEPLPGERIVDRFDATPEVANIIAYDDGEPVGTIRMNRDTGLGLPPQSHYDFDFQLQVLKKEWCKARSDPFSLASGGMFAIRYEWRKRRDVIYAMLKIAAGVLDHWRVSHILGAVNHETVSIYRRFGFTPIDDPIWIESVGNKIVPLIGHRDATHEWAFGGLDDDSLGLFKDRFERRLLNPGDHVFSEGDSATHAYIVDSGNVQIVRNDPELGEVTLATLGRGDLFGELALVDDTPRSATATALTHVELIALSRDDFLQDVDPKPAMLQMLQVVAGRLRRTDDLVMVMAYAPQTSRVEFQLEAIRQSAQPDRKRPGVLLAKLGPAEIARLAQVRENEVRRVLERQHSEGKLEYSDTMIRFFR